MYPAMKFILSTIFLNVFNDGGQNKQRRTAEELSAGFKWDFHLLAASHGSKFKYRVDPRTRGMLRL